LHTERWCEVSFHTISIEHVFFRILLCLDYKNVCLTKQLHIIFGLLLAKIIIECDNYITLHAWKFSAFLTAFLAKQLANSVKRNVIIIFTNQFESNSSIIYPIFNENILKIITLNGFSCPRNNYIGSNCSVYGKFLLSPI
jgi:hypothetical protein